MFSNYIKSALRNMWKNKGFSLINIFGLAGGIACSLLIFLFIRDEKSYDRFHKDPDQIYRVVKDFGNDDGTKLPDATTPPAVAPALQKEIPQIAHVTRVFPGWGGSFLIKYGDKKFTEEKLFRVDSSFFDVFSFPFVEGNPKTAFTNINSILLTEQSALKYFGKEDPMGKVLKIDNLGDMMVTGVLKDVPRNSHFHFDFLVSVRKFAGNFDGNWDWYNFYTYIRTRAVVDTGKLNAQIQAIYLKNNDKGTNVFYVQKVPDIHLTSNLKWELEPNGDKLYVYVFTVIGLFILLIAAINYINLATARASIRAKEIGVRKVAGAVRSSLISQFLAESVLTCLLACIIALGIAQLLLPVVNELTQKNLSLTGNPLVIGYLLITVVFLGIIAGFIPAAYLSSFRPIIVLKGLKVNEGKALGMRKALVIVQFTISIVLIIGALVISRQMQYIRSARLGLDKDQVMIIKNAGYMSASSRNAFTNRIAQLPGIVKVTHSDGVIGGQNWTNGLRAKGSENEQLVNFLTVGYDFTDALGIQMKEGRGFSAAFPADTMTNESNGQLEQVFGSIILNEKAVKDLGVGEPAIGKEIVWGEEGDTTYNLRVVGVTKDFHFTSFRSEIKPFAFVISNNRSWYFVLKLSTDRIQSTIQEVQKTWNEYSQERPFEYNFLDETYSRLYTSESRFQKVFIFLVILGIIIACLGLLGLSTFAAQQRIKEIGIRKVLGASVTSVVALLSKDFLKLVIVALVLAVPIAWYAMGRWLEDFAYRIHIEWWVFIVAAIIAIVIAFITISTQAVKAAVANPVKSLRTE